MAHRRFLVAAALVLVVGASAMAVYWLAIRESNNTLLKRAQLALGDARFEQAEKYAQQVLARDSCHGDALFIAGVSATKREHFPEAVDYFDRISDQHPHAVEARFRAGSLLVLHLFQLTPAEKRLRNALQLDPSHGGAQQHLSALLGLYGDTFGAMQLRLARVQAGNFSEMDLLVLALGESVDDAMVREQIVRHSANDPLTWLIEANTAIQNRDLASADGLLQRVVSERDDLLLASARLGRVLLDRGDRVRLEAWLQQLPSAADQLPDIWLIRGEWARQQGDDRGAVRCYAEALLRAPASQRANYQLAQLLSTLGNANNAQVYAARANVLHDLSIAAREYLKAGTPAAIEQLVAVSRRGHLAWDMWGWREIARAVPGNSHSQPQIKRPEPGSPRILEAERDLKHLVSAYPLPRVMHGPASGMPADPKTEAANGGVGEIAFTDDAATAGLDFQYIPGDGPSEVGLRMFQFSGGGVAVLDFDQDGWSDFYLPQGHLWPPKPEDQAANSGTRDRLFRNLGNGRFADVTESGALSGRGYGQGATVGDFNSDGFPDVYVATLTHNRLYRNDGDGTFTDVTTEAGTAGGRWTTSCLMADLNGDGLPDIYDVNYLEAPDLNDRICSNPDGRPRRCSPFELDASQDQMYLNSGDGRFEEVTHEAGILVPGGKGLGIVAADFDGSGRLGLFVANDMMPNFFFVNETESPGARPRFTESALAAGLAYDRDGRAQGCMGIAIGDVQGDGLLDMFVTNYYQESNTLYEQKSRFSFEDVTHSSGLREPSLQMLGFGTQFLDADLDGQLDLVAVNGHVDDETYRGIPFHMPPQFFRNSGVGKFAEVRADRLGPWFAGRYLGRGLAKVDWNRDGREDFVVTNLDSPVALVTNQTQNAGHSIRLQLRGVHSSRDAIGTTVRVQIQGHEQIQQLTAGDGYESSNQRQLVFGLGAAKSAEVVTIRWPGGSTQQFKDVVSDVECLAIENDSRLFVLPSAAKSQE